MGMFKRGEIWYFRKQIAGEEHVVSTGFRDKRLAERAALQLEQEIREGRWGWKKAPRFTEWGKEFLREHAPRRSAHTLDSYTRVVEEATAALGHRRLDEITRDDMRRYLRGLSQGKQLVHGKVLRRLCSVAVAEGKAKASPMKGVALPRQKSRTRVLSAEEEAKLFAAVTGSLENFIRLGLGLGLRVSELLSLTPESKRGALVHVVGKGGKPRAVPALGSVAKAFELQAIGVGAGNRLFSWSRRAANSRCYRLAARLKIPSFSPHDLRRTYATRWAPKVHPTVLQKLLGHNDIATTMKFYVHLGEQEVLDAVAKVVTEEQNQRPKA